MTTTIRSYRFECCWLLLVVALALVPGPASAQEFGYEDTVGDCPICLTDLCSCAPQ